MLVAPPPPGSVPVVQVSVWFGTSLVHPAGSGDRIVTRLSYTSVPTPTPDAEPMFVTVSVYVTVPPAATVVGLADLATVNFGTALTHSVLDVWSPLTNVAVLITGK